MSRRLALALALMLLAGCSSPSPAVLTPRVAPSAQPEVSQTPWYEEPAQAIATLCDGKVGSAKENTLPQAIMRFLAAAPASVADPLTELASRSKCLHLDLVTADPPLAVGWMLNGMGAVLWQEGGTWKAAPMTSPAETPEILLQTDWPEGREVVLAGHISGTGGYGSITVLRQQGDQWQVITQSDRYGKFTVRALGTDLLLVTARKYENQPLAWAANCCVPTNYQWLWKREAGTYKVVAERLVPTPYYSLNVFLGALRFGQPDWLPKVGTAAAAEQARVLGLDRAAVGFVTAGGLAPPVTEAEMFAWEALPAAYRRPLPPVESLKFTLPVTDGAVPLVQVELTWRDGAWLVTAVAAK